MPYRLLFHSCLSLLVLSVYSANAQEHPAVTLVDNGESMCVIVAPAFIMESTAERDRQPDVVRLRKSVLDLAHYLEKMSGAKVEVVHDVRPAEGKRLPIYIGTTASEIFGPPAVQAKARQGLRLVVDPERGVGLIGESPLATSYAIYTLLDRLGCRWYMPSELGEVIPEHRTITLPAGDESLAPYTYHRTIWYADDDYKRRNRMGGLLLHANHALEGYVDKALLEAHPEWRGETAGKVSTHRLKWSKPGVAEAIADGVVRTLEKYPDRLSVSLSPGDGLGFDDTDDRSLDAGDFDPSVGEISITDRQVWLCNKVIGIVNQTHPGIIYGMLAYGLSTRPPVRESVSPQLIPEIAPITYRRAHPMTWDAVPDNKELRSAIQGWAKVSPAISYYFYGWFLAEPSAPNPFITKWSEDLQFIYKHGNCRFWQPETLPNFESSLHALYLGIRMSWDPTQEPDAIIDEFHRNFYGHAAGEMAAYWQAIDEGWTSTPEYAGAGFGHLRRWTPEKMQHARELLNVAIAAAQTATEKDRIAMADKSLALFAQFMALRHDLAEGRFAGLDERGQAYIDRANELAEAYREQYAFCWMPYFANRDAKSWYGRYFQIFYNQTYQDAGRLAKETEILSGALCDWRYMADKESVGDAQGWQKPDFADTSWPTTDICVDTWSALNLHAYLGKMWYRRMVDIPAAPEGKKTYLWIGGTDGTAKVFVNGMHVPWTDAKGESQEVFNGYCKPGTFDISSALKPGSNQVTILADRNFINELGTGGLCGAPVVIVRDK